jgi:hypothetical protein
MLRGSSNKLRFLHSSCAARAKVLVALYPDPVSGFPPKYARDSVPTIKIYPDGQTVPSPKAIDFVPGLGEEEERKEKNQRKKKKKKKKNHRSFIKANFLVPFLVSWGCVSFLSQEGISWW